MQQQRIAGSESRPSQSEDDNVVLGFVLDGPTWLWSIDEVARELGNRGDAEDALARLVAAGLLHRLGEFVFATRAARVAAELSIGTV